MPPFFKPVQTLCFLEISAHDLLKLIKVERIPGLIREAADCALLKRALDFDPSERDQTSAKAIRLATVSDGEANRDKGGQINLQVPRLW